MPMATILGRVVTYREELSPIMSHDPLITWSFEINDKRKSLYLYYLSVYGQQTWQDG